VQVLKKYDDWERRTGYFRQKKVKTKFIFLDDAGNGKLLHWLLLSLVCWLMLARRLCVYNAGLKVDTSGEILTVVMTSYYENVRSCKRHIVVCRALCFWRFTSLFLGLATHYCQSWSICYCTYSTWKFLIFVSLFCNNNIVWPTLSAVMVPHTPVISMMHLWQLCSSRYTAKQIKNCTKDTSLANKKLRMVPHTPVKGTAPINYHLKSKVSIMLLCLLCITGYTAIWIKIAPLSSG